MRRGSKFEGKPGQIIIDRKSSFRFDLNKRLYETKVIFYGLPLISCEREVAQFVGRDHQHVQ